MRTLLTIKTDKPNWKWKIVVKYPNENDSEGTETNKTTAVPSFLTKISPDAETAKDKNSFVVYTWAEDYVKLSV